MIIRPIFCKLKKWLIPPDSATFFFENQDVGLQAFILLLTHNISDGRVGMGPEVRPLRIKLFLDPWNGDFLETYFFFHGTGIERLLSSPPRPCRNSRAVTQDKSAVSLFKFCRDNGRFAVERYP